MDVKYVTPPGFSPHSPSPKFILRLHYTYYALLVKGRIAIAISVYEYRTAFDFEPTRAVIAVASTVNPVQFVIEIDFEGCSEFAAVAGSGFLQTPLLPREHVSNQFRSIGIH